MCRRRAMRVAATQSEGAIARLQKRDEPCPSLPVMCHDRICLERSGKVRSCLLSRAFGLSPDVEHPSEGKSAHHSKLNCLARTSFTFGSTAVAR